MVISLILQLIDVDNIILKHFLRWLLLIVFNLTGTFSVIIIEFSGGRLPHRDGVAVRTRHRVVVKSIGFLTLALRALGPKQRSRFDHLLALLVLFFYRSLRHPQWHVYWRPFLFFH